MTDTRFGTDPHDIYPEDFETDVFRIVDQFYDDLGIEIQVEMGDQVGLFVEVIAVRDNVGHELYPPVATPQTFYSVDDFRKFVDSFAPEDY